MAIYNNREVSILGPNNMANSPETINVRHVNGSTENVSVNSVHFTQEEKDALVKKHPSKYNDVNVAKPEDVEAVKTGVAPSYDPSYTEAAKAEIHAKKQAEILKKNTEAAKAQAEKAQPQSTPVSTPVTSVPAQVQANQSSN